MKCWKCAGLPKKPVKKADYFVVTTWITPPVDMGGDITKYFIRQLERMLPECVNPSHIS